MTIKNANKELITLFSGQQATLTTPKIYVKLTKSHEKALVLNQVIFWSTKSELNNGWFYKSYAEWFDEILIPERTLRRIFQSLANDGLIKTKTNKVRGDRVLMCKPEMDTIIEQLELLITQTATLSGNESYPQSPVQEMPQTAKVAGSQTAKVAGSTIYADKSTDENKEIVTVFCEKPQKQPKTPVTEVITIRDLILDRMNAKALPVNKILVEEIEFYVDGRSDDLTAIHAINIAIKLCKQKRWTRPHEMPKIDYHVAHEKQKEAVIKECKEKSIYKGQMGALLASIGR